MASGAKLIGLVLTERQARTVLMYLRLLESHGAGRTAAKDIGLVRAKIDRALRHVDGGAKREGQ